MRFTDRQLPGDGEVFFDHLAWMVPDMARAEAAFERLGFPLTPYSEHTNADPDGGPPIQQGTANRLAMLEVGYLELLCARDGIDDAVSTHLKSAVARYEGVHLVAFSCADAEAHHRRLTEGGFEPFPLVPLRRDVEAADGSDAEVAFSVIRTPMGAMPEGRIQMLAHHTPEHMWQRRYMPRENAIDALTEVILVVEDPLEAVVRLGKLLDTPGRATEEGAVIEFARGRMVLTTANVFRAAIPGAVVPSLPYIAVVGLRSRDLGQTRSFLRERSVALIHDGVDALCVDSSDSLGTYISICEGPGIWPLS